jgi:hypothetical protein
MPSTKAQFAIFLATVRDNQAPGPGFLVAVTSHRRGRGGKYQSTSKLSRVFERGAATAALSASDQRFETAKSVSPTTRTRRR